MDIEIKDGKDYLEEVKSLIAEYTQMLGRNLSFQNLEDELKDPSKKYSTPQGELLVAVVSGKVIGMVAYHRHSAIRCEMKRLYVRPEARGLRLGETLVREIIAHARTAGYSEMVLDTITPLNAAIRLYEKAGFKECEPYYNNPMNDVLYMKKHLQ